MTATTKSEPRIKEKLVVFRLVAQTEIHYKEGGKQKKTWGTTEIMSDGWYETRDESGAAIRKQLLVGTTIHPVTGKEQKVGINGIPFINGEVALRDGADAEQISALRECKNNRDFSNRLEDDKVIYYEVNSVEERLSGVDKHDLIVTAYKEIESAEPEVLIEYANALGSIDTEEIELLLSDKSTKKKDIQVTEQYKMLVKEMKNVASTGNTEAFVLNFRNPLRPYKAAINEGIKLRTIRYMGSQREFGWVMGTGTQVIKQVPAGIPDTKEWFANWLVENQNVYDELKQKNKVALIQQ